MKKLKISLTCMCVSAASPVFAAWSDLSWQFGLGLGINHSYGLIEELDDIQNKEPQFQLLFEVEYKNWFLENPGLRAGKLVGDAALGYRLHQDDHHDFSLLSVSYHDGFGPDVNITEGIRTKKLEGLNNRKNDFLLGFRYQYHATDNHLFALQVGRDAVAHKGSMARAFYGIRFEKSNWDIYLNNEVNWYSGSLVDYYYGVTPEETRPGRDVYAASNGWRWHSGVVGVYPLSTQWVFEMGVGGNWYSNSFSRSPLTRGNKELVSFGLVRYLF